MSHRYMPDPASIPRRAFTVVDHALDNDPDAEDKKLVVFIDHDGNEVHRCTGKQVADYCTHTPTLPTSAVAHTHTVDKDKPSTT
jgi:hypothetical protein